MAKTKELIINDENYLQHVAPMIDGEQTRRGLVPRDYAANPLGCYRGIDPVDFPLIPQSEWSARIKEAKETKSRLSDRRMIANNGNPIKSLDQNGQGFCWSYSVCAALTLLRMKKNLPYVRLSAHALACKIYNFQDRGAWGALAAEKAIELGYPDVAHWQEKSMNRQYDNAATWENAKLHRLANEGWWDLGVAVYDRNMTFAQMATLLLLRIPVVTDFNWWGHSVCAVDLEEIEPGSFGPRIWNSWTDNWGTLGMGVLQGSRGVPDGATAPRSALAA